MSAYRNKVVLVTGGASGIGRALSEALASEGAQVLLSDIDDAGAQALADRLTQAGHSAWATRLDVTDAEAFKAWVSQAVEAHGRIDFLFNNAGIAILGEAFEQSLEDWNAVLDVNVRGVVHGVFAAYPRMVEQGHGHIVNVSSAAGLAPSPHFTAYAASKHAVVGLSTSLRAEASALGVKVSVACPGFVDTPIMDRCGMVNMDRKLANQEVMGLATTPERCAKAILKGVRRDQALIVVTGHGKAFHWLQRFAPWLMRWLARISAKRMRRLRTAPLPAVDSAPSPPIR